MTRYPPDRDHEVYEDRRSVAHYAKETDLQAPEAIFLSQVANALHEMDMLDIGVGAGRTTLHFAPLAKSYLGIDYSKAMIDHCVSRFPDIRFLQSDVRVMDFARPESFDLVLFSYNGLDHLAAHERATALHEMKRILRPGGFLVFSTHNSNYIATIIERFRFRISASPKETLRSLKWALMFNIQNPTLLLRAPLAEGRVCDGVHSFKSSGLHYVRPDLQVDALRRLGMVEIICAGNESAEFMSAGDVRIKEMHDPWVYFVCRKPESRSDADWRSNEAAGKVATQDKSTAKS